LNIRANTTPAIVGSVVFGYDSNNNFRTESAPPYAFAGDAGGNGDYHSWTPASGEHTLIATSYSGSGVQALSSTLFQLRSLSLKV